MPKHDEARRTRRWLAGPLILLLAPAVACTTQPGPSAAQPEPSGAGAEPGALQPTVAETRWLALELAGQHAGGVTITVTPRADGGLEVSERMQLVLVRENVGMVDRFESVRESRSEYDASDRLVREREVEVEAGVTTTTEIEIVGGELRFRYEGPARSESQTYTLPPDFRSSRQVLGELIGRARAGELPATAEYSGFSDERRAFERHQTTIKGRERVATPKGELEVWRLTERNLDQGDEVELWVDDARMLVKLQAYGLLSAHWVADDPFAREVTGRMTSELVVKGQAIPDRPREVRLVFRVEGDDPSLPALFEDGPYHQVVQAGGEYRLTLRSMADKAAAARNVALPVPAVPADVKPFLAATHLSQSDDPKIVERARAIVGSTTNALEATRRIVLWVALNLQKEGGARGQATAVEVLQSGAGDCTEHSALAVALLRAVGIPARNVSGIVLAPEPGRVAAGYHAWSEVWLGEWIAIDAMFAEVGVSARYLHFGYDEPGLVSGGAKIGRTLGRTSIEIEGYQP